MVKIFKIAEYCALLSQTFQKVVPDRRLVILVSKHDNQCAIEMFRTPRTSVLERVLTETDGSAQKSNTIPARNRETRNIRPSSRFMDLDDSDSERLDSSERRSVSPGLYNYPIAV